MKKNDRYWKMERKVFRMLILVCTLVLVLAIGVAYFMTDSSGSIKIDKSDTEYTGVPVADDNRIENGIHIRTGLKDGRGLTETVANCTGCHSAKLIIQNKLDREAWIANIRWMQASQNLWDLGKNEDIILDYLVTNYPPDNTGRREPLTITAWYELE